MKKALSRKQRVMRNRRIALTVLMGMMILVIILLTIRKEPETVEEEPVSVSEDTGTEYAQEEATMEMEKEVFRRESIKDPEPEAVKDTLTEYNIEDASSLSENAMESEPASDKAEDSDYSEKDNTEYDSYSDNEYGLDDEGDYEEDFGFEFFEEDDEKEW